LKLRKDQAANASRNHLQSIFLDEISKSQLSKDKTIAVAVVGGSHDKIEVKSLISMGFSLEVTTFGIQDSDIFVDLNKTSTVVSHEKYDLVLCSQVLEHTWNLGATFKFLESLSLPNSLVWLACPTSNKKHGSPNYYSAGFQSSFLVEWMSLMGFEILSSGDFGSQRLYNMTHYYQKWPSEKELNNPIGSINFSLRNFSNFKKTLKQLFGALLISRWSNEFEFGGPYSTESYCLAKKLSSASE
jgi:hypothetical protein